MMVEATGLEDETNLKISFIYKRFPLFVPRRSPRIKLNVIKLVFLIKK